MPLTALNPSSQSDWFNSRYLECCRIQQSLAARHDNGDGKQYVFQDKYLLSPHISIMLFPWTGLDIIRKPSHPGMKNKIIYENDSEMGTEPYIVSG
jgi:hypothetical protein